MSAEPPGNQTDEPAPPAVVARGIGLRGPWGPVYGPVDLEIPQGGLNVLICPAGSGRTALLMTIAGRMEPKDGQLSVFGATRADDIFALFALAGIDELDTVPESVTVRDLPSETRDELASRAARTGRSLQEYLRSELIELARRPDPEVLAQRIVERKQRTATKLSASKIIGHRDAGRR